MTQNLKILIVDDSEADVVLVARHLKKEGLEFTYERVDTAVTMQAALDNHRWDLVIADYHMPSFTVIEALNLLKQHDMDIPFIIISGVIKDEAAVQAMRAGAHDFLLKENLVRLVPALERELREAGIRTAQREALKALSESENRYRKLAEREAIVRRIIQTLHSSLDVDEAFEKLAHDLGIYLNSDRCFISRYDPVQNILSPPIHEYRSSAEIESVIAAGPEMWGTLCSYAKELCGQPEPIDFSNKSQGLTGQAKIEMNQLNVQSGIGCSIRYRGQCLGILLINQVEHHRTWNQEEKDIIQVVAAQAAISIHQSQLYQDEQAAKAEAQNANQRKSQFLANMSHELRTPLNAVIGYSEMMLQGMALTPEKQERYAQNIASSGRHLLDLINEILDIAKIESGKTTLTMETIPLAPFIQEKKAIFAEMADKKRIRLNFEIQTHLENIVADPLRLKQILMNLLSNAIKFNREGGTVNVRLYETEDKQWVVFEIEDSGVGIPVGKMPELFTEFYQVDNSFSREQEGTGLGLAVSKRLIELHGGSICVKSEEGVGSTFTIKLPVAKASNVQEIRTPARIEY